MLTNHSHSQIEYEWLSVTSTLQKSSMLRKRNKQTFDITLQLQINLLGVYKHIISTHWYYTYNEPLPCKKKCEWLSVSIKITIKKSSDSINKQTILYLLQIITLGTHRYIKGQIHYTFYTYIGFVKWYNNDQQKHSKL
jgi:hypothetical protein